MFVYRINQLLLTLWITQAHSVNFTDFLYVLLSALCAWVCALLAVWQHGSNVFYLPGDTSPPRMSLYMPLIYVLSVCTMGITVFSWRFFFFFLSLNKIKRNLQCCVILCNIICKYLLLHQQIENKIKRRQKFKKCCCSFWACACLRWD